MNTIEKTPSLSTYRTMVLTESNIQRFKATDEHASDKVIELWNSISVRIILNKRVRWKQDIQLTLYLLQKEGVNVDEFSKKVGIKPAFV